MKSWKSYSREEKRMLVIIGVLLVAVLLSFGRIREQFSKGIDFFFSKPSSSQETGNNGDGGK